MSSPEPLQWLDGWFEVRVRVRYPEVDPQGVVHHAVYLHYFELARTEMLRALAMPYSAMEEAGTRLVVVESRLRHRLPAGYDELLRARVRVVKTTRIRIFLEYRILRETEDQLVCEGETVLAAVDFTGKPRELPERLGEVLKRGSGPI
jgi:acyl-CoA thioester hydrolase